MLLVIMILTLVRRLGIQYLTPLFQRRAKAVHHGDKIALDSRGHALGIIFGVLFSVRWVENQAEQL